jgi:hypothetical protein
MQHQAAPGFFVLPWMSDPPPLNSSLASHHNTATRLRVPGSQAALYAIAWEKADWLTNPCVSGTLEVVFPGAGGPCHSHSALHSIKQGTQGNTM